VVRAGHLKDHDLSGGQLVLGYAVPRLDDGGFSRVSVVATSATVAKNRRMETAFVVSSAPWSMHLKSIVRSNDRSRQLNSTRSPAIWHRHLARTKGHLVAGDAQRLENGAADHALGLFVEVSVVVVAFRRVRLRRRGRFIRERHSAATF